ncbi:MAG: NnrS family protein [Rhizobiaceae bacterium]|nr:NnrS family protein [Rhizobiaceae bacterium]
MKNVDDAMQARRGAVPRGLLRTGPVLFSYGFRPFFLGAAVWACVAMALWIVALAADIAVGGDYGALAWHGHEMLFGFASAVLAGFLLTAVPNWTGRLPVSGPPLMALFTLWCLGRAAMLAPGLIGTTAAAVMDALFLPTLLFICVREVVAGRKWADLKVVAGLGVLAAANICFHYETLMRGAPDYSQRFAVAAYVGLVTVIGGRILPSFTRNWLAKRGRTDFPAPYARFDVAAIVLSVAALALWAVVPESPVTALACAVAAVLQLGRLHRWRGWTTLAEPLVAILHVAYVFVPLGFAALAAAAIGLFDRASAMHVLTIGTVATMMLAVMTRATRGHTGRELTSSLATNLAYIAIVLCAVIRPLTAIAPDHAHEIYAVAGLLWLAAFGLFLTEHAPMLLRKRRQPIG